MSNRLNGDGPMTFETSSEGPAPKENMSLYYDGDVINVGAITLRLIHTPGHSPGSMVVVIDGKQQAGARVLSARTATILNPASTRLCLESAVHR